MRKLGLYIQETSASGLREMLARVRPAVVLLHLDGGDLGAWIRQEMPETFVIGRYVWTQAQQDERLAASSGVALADFLMAQKGAGACHAFMLFNECMTSPVDHGGEAEFRARAARLDVEQVAFRAALVTRGFEAVAFNFAAGNWPAVSHYREHFPLTMGAYKYFGFHVYGWPRLMGAGWRSNVDETLRIVDALGGGQPRGGQPRGVAPTCIITEMALTRAYAQDGHPDLGWLSEGDGAPLSVDDYASDLAAVNEEMCKRPNVLGGCLFNTAPNAVWTTFAVTEELVGRLEQLPECTAIPDTDGTDDTDDTERIVLRLPFAGSYRMTQGWGERPEVYKAFGLKGHEGVDWALPLGTPVLACADGVVDRVDTVALTDRKADPYGLSVRIKHAKCTTIYAHLSRVDVVKGREVKAGEQIGLSGSTGNSDGPHLHLSFRLDGANLKDGWIGTSDPMKYMTTDDRPPTAGPTARALFEEAGRLMAQAMALLVRAQEVLGNDA